MKKVLSMLVAVLILLSASCSYFTVPDSELEASELASAKYPEMEHYPDADKMTQDAYANWSDSRAEFLAHSGDVSDRYIDFVVETSRSIVEEGENIVYSPMSLYMALSMLAETTGGNSRQEVLDLLQSESIENLRKEAQALFLSSYIDDGVSESILANSLWTNNLASESLGYKEETLNFLEEQYFADAFSGDMGDPEYDKQLQDWLNEKTGDFLEEAVSKEGFKADTILSLVSTVYYKSSWLNSFYEGANTQEIFHGVNKDQEVDFMHKSKYNAPYYVADNFSVLEESMEAEGGRMLFILPDEGVSPEDLINSESFSTFLNNKEELNYRTVNLSLPKFDVEQTIELNQHLESLGLNEILVPGIADFSSLAENSGQLYLSKAIQSSRVAIDEDGVTAASYTKLDVDTTAAPVEEETIDFILDRPFVFVILTEARNPMFIGVVNQL